ncbi:hypothetical protein FBR04_02755 [Betaproteobacteria bacterium PRO7]|jgi:hypothetical protein|nr:hypothetical protein [Betaproteobacteria bacterium PRO7]
MTVRQSRSARRSGQTKKHSPLSIVRRQRVLSEEPRTEEERFAFDVLAWLRRWVEARADADLSAMQPGVFIYAGSEPPSNIMDDLEEAPGFRKTHDSAISGVVHVCSLEMRKVHRKGVAFRDVPHALLRLRQMKLDHLPIVVFSPAQLVALVKRSGIDADDCEQVPFRTSPATSFDFGKVNSCLDEFHRLFTRHPESYCRIWAVPKRRKLKPNPEKQIQGSLMAYFYFFVRPHGVLVDEEFTTFMGRGDVRLVRWKGAAQLEVCMMELKVLSAQRTDAKNEQWALGGLAQIRDYRSTQPLPGPSYLCCFDGRAKDVDLPSVDAAAARETVVYRRFYMLNSSGRSTQ